MKRSRLTAYLLLLGAFVLGAVAGGAAVYAHARGEYARVLEGRGPREDRLLWAFADELGLSDAQRTKVRAIVEKHRHTRRKLLRDVMQKCGHPIREHRQRIDDEIRAILTPAQRARFDQLSERQWKRFMNGRPPRRHGHGSRSHRPDE